MDILEKWFRNAIKQEIWQMIIISNYYTNQLSGTTKEHLNKLNIILLYIT